MKKLRKHIAGLLAAALVLGMMPYPQAQAAAVKLNKTKLTLTVGNTAKLKLKNNKKKVKWTSSKKSVATVSQSGTVRAKKKGTATITAKVGKKKYKCKVTCRAKATNNSANSNANSSGSILVNSVVLNSQKLTLNVGETSKLGVTISPSNATSKSVRWESFYPDIATVDKNGVVKAVSRGRTVILVEKDDKYGCAHDYCEVLVVKPKATPKPTPTMKPMATYNPIVLPTPTVRPTPYVSPSPTPSTSPTPTPDATVTKAPLVDQSAPTIPEANLIKNYQVRAVKGTGYGNVKVVDVTITGTELAEHTNSANVKGHWVGIGIPKGSGYLQGRGNCPAITSLGGQTYGTNSDGVLNNNTVTFYFDVKHAGNDTGYVIVKNGTAGNESYIIYNVNFTNVTWKNGTAAPSASANPSANPSGSPSANPSGSPSANPSASPSGSPSTPTSAPIKDNTVTAAPLADHSTPAITGDLIKNYSVTATKGAEMGNVKVVNVTITGNDLVEHTNGVGTKGHWVGIGIPKGDTYVQKRGSAPTVITALGTLGYSPNTDGVIDSNTVSFYFNVQRLGNDIGYVVVKNGTGVNESYIIYNVNFSNVKWAGEQIPSVAPEVVTAPVVDQNSNNPIPSNQLISNYGVSRTLDTVHSTGKVTVVNVKVTGTGLKKHFNSENTEAFWAGIGVANGDGHATGFGKLTAITDDLQIEPGIGIVLDANHQSFYFGTVSKDKIPDGYVVVKNGTGSSATYIIYNIDFSGVTLAK